MSDELMANNLQTWTCCLHDMLHVLRAKRQGYELTVSKANLVAIDIRRNFRICQSQHNDKHTSRKIKCQGREMTTHGGEILKLWELCIVSVVSRLHLFLFYPVDVTSGGILRPQFLQQSPIPYHFSDPVIVIYSYLLVIFDHTDSFFLAAFSSWC